MQPAIHSDRVAHASDGRSTRMSAEYLVLFVGITVNLIIFSLNHLAGWSVNHGDYTPFSVVPQVSAVVYDETQAYVPGPSRFVHTGQLQSELDVFELRDV